MMNRWIKYNPNPLERRVGDCAIRACCKATNRTWDEVFDALVEIAFEQKDVLSANKVWGQYLAENGYRRYEPDYPMDVWKFCMNFPNGTYVLGLDGHVVTVVDGRFYDTWDSSERNVIYFWDRESEREIPFREGSLEYGLAKDAREAIRRYNHRKSK